MTTKTIIIGGSFAGLTTALELKRKGKQAHEVVLVSNRESFMFIPSLIWVPPRLARSERHHGSYRANYCAKQV
jgi:NADH dehydrogenase FAD-containing subunit